MMSSCYKRASIHTVHTYWTNDERSILCKYDRQTQPWTIYSHLSHSTSEHSSDFYEAYMSVTMSSCYTRASIHIVCTYWMHEQLIIMCKWPSDPTVNDLFTSKPLNIRKLKVALMKHICRSRCPVTTREHPCIQYIHIERLMSDSLCVNDHQTQPWTIYSHLSHWHPKTKVTLMKHICRSRCPVTTREHPST
jgi:hypothetical protein